MDERGLERTHARGGWRRQVWELEARGGGKALPVHNFLLFLSPAIEKRSEKEVKCIWDLPLHL